MTVVTEETRDPITQARAAVTAALVEKAGADAAFRALLVNNPKEAVKAMVGVDPLPGHTVRVIEEQAGEVCIVLPRRLDQEELPDSLLDLASGGTTFATFRLWHPSDNMMRKR